MRRTWHTTILNFVSTNQGKRYCPRFVDWPPGWQVGHSVCKCLSLIVLVAQLVHDLDLGADFYLAGKILEVACLEA